MTDQSIQCQFIQSIKHMRNSEELISKASHLKFDFTKKKKKNIFKTKKKFVVNSISTKQKRKGGEFSKPLAFGVNCSKFEAISRKILNCTFL